MLANVQNTTRGRKKKVGSLMRLPDGRLGTFVGYCPNDHCLSKICMDFEDAKDFSQRHGRHRKKLLNRILLTLLTRLETSTR